MSVHDFQPHREPSPETKPLDIASHSASPFAALAEREQTDQKPVLVIGWGLALLGGALGWAAIAFVLK